MFHYSRRIYTKLAPISLYQNLQVKRDAGHSKWANIKHIKAQKDGQKSLMFTKLGRQIKVAVQEGGSTDPKLNIRLEQIIEQAKRMSMPVATIDSIIKSTQANKSLCKSHLLEIKGPGSCTILCEVFTENLHGLRQLLATPLKKHSSKFSDGGGGVHYFDQKGIIIAELPQDGNKSDILEIATEHAIECGAEDVELLETGEIEFSCSPSAFQNVQRGLEKLNYKITSASIEYIPNKLQTLSDSDLQLCSSLLEKLENHPDVVRLYDNIG